MPRAAAKKFVPQIEAVPESGYIEGEEKEVLVKIREPSKSSIFPSSIFDDVDRLFEKLRQIAFFYYVLLRSNCLMMLTVALPFATSKFIYETSYSQTHLCMVGSLYGFLYLLIWATCNQYSGVEQDTINRSGLDNERVLSLGLITKENLALLIPIHTVSFLAFGLYVGLFWPPLSSAFAFVWYNLLRGDMHWTTQFAVSHIVMMALVELPRLYITGEFDWTYATVLGAFTAGDTLFSDLKDVEGDVVAGRYTLPMMLGDKGARLGLMAKTLAEPIAFAFTLVLHSNRFSAVFALATLFRIPLLWIMRKRRGAKEYARMWNLFGFTHTVIWLTVMPFACQVPNLVSTSEILSHALSSAPL